MLRRWRWFIWCVAEQRKNFLCAGVWSKLIQSCGSISDIIQITIHTNSNHVKYWIFFPQHDKRVYRLSQVALRGYLWIALLRCRICWVSVAQDFSLTAPDVHAILTTCHPTTWTTRVLRCNVFDNFWYCIRQNFKPGWRQRGRLNEPNLQRQVAQPF
jgi:hypothetical protein